jgi:hypothetical protein
MVPTRFVSSARTSNLRVLATFVIFAIFVIFVMRREAAPSW